MPPPKPKPKVAKELCVYGLGILLNETELQAMCSHYPLDPDWVSLDGPFTALNMALSPRKRKIIRTRIPFVDSYTGKRGYAYWYVWRTRAIWEGYPLPKFDPERELSQIVLDRFLSQELVKASPEGMFALEKMRKRVLNREWPAKYGVPLPYWTKKQLDAELEARRPRVEAWMREMKAEKEAQEAVTSAEDAEGSQEETIVLAQV